MQLEEKLMEEFSSLDRIKTRVVIEQLIKQEVLQFALMPSLLTKSSYSNLLAKIGNTKLDVREYPLLQDLHKELDKYNITPFIDTEKTLQNLSFCAQKVVDSEHCLQVDLAALEGQFTLPTKIGEELSETAELLWRLSSELNNNTSCVLKDYHIKFIEKYGFVRRIPLLELLGTQELGIPEPYLHTNTVSQTPTSEKSPWKEWLKTQWSLCVHEHRQEITLTEQDLQQFLGDKEDFTKAPLSFDLFCEVVATSTESIDRGEYELYLTGHAWEGGSTFGRFLDLLGTEAIEPLKKFYASEEQLDSQCTFVETSYMPSSCRGANVVMHPDLRTVCLDLVEDRQINALSLDQIYVGANEDRLYITNQEGNREWIFRTGNVLNAQNSPIPLRFLKDVSNSRYEPFQNFSWDSLIPFSFLPRIKFKKSILSPAQWFINKDMLNARELTESLKKWMDLWNLPRYLLLAKGDVRAFFDRRCEGHLQEIVSELKKGVTINLIEKVGQLPSKQWLCSTKGTHFHELVVPFLKNPTVHRESLPSLSPRPAAQSMKMARRKSPGSDWLYIKLYLHQEHQERFILNHLAPFANHWMSQRWFLVRYADPNPHLRVRFHGEQDKILHTLIPAIHDVSSHWLEDKWIGDLQFGTYEREFERYGGSKLIEVIEEFFFADTETTLDLLMMIANKQTVLPIYVIAAISLVDLLKELGALSDMQTLDFFTLISKKEELKGIREWKKVLSTLTEHVMKDTLITLNTEEACSLQAALNKRKNALHQLTRTMQKLYEQNLLSCSIESIQNSIIHMHCNRLMGPELHLEQKARLYANSSVKTLFKRKEYPFRAG